LDDLERVFGALPDLLKTKKLSIEDLKQWPIFREVRKSQEYSKLREKMEAMQEQIQGFVETLNEELSQRAARR
jgi:hypothetical protein